MNNSNVNNSITLTQIQGFQFESNPLVSVPLKNLPNIADNEALLTIYSSDDSLSDNFLLEISNPSHSTQYDLVKTIIFSFLAVTITNLCSVMGVICIPVKRSKYFPLILSFMMSLAVSAFLTTSTLVLIPESMRMFYMPLEFGGQGRTYMYKMGCVPAGIFFFFLLEYFILILPRLLKWESSSNSDIKATDSKNWDSQNGDSNLEISVEVSAGIKDGESSSSISQLSETMLRSHRGRCCLTFSRKKFTQIAPVAWMILLGDSFHNIMDGMSIAVGFTESSTIGLALTLSILFEELPGELGDFAILISSGFSVKSAIAANFLSACSSYIGLVIGLIIGEVATGAYYVFAICGGFFIYISLSDMLPELREALEEKEKKCENSTWLFLIQVMGLLTGFGCVLGIALASDYIAF
ncbi:hypothetical protein Aperf_G00000077490 [Anoplocephala perfoliata]